MNEIIHRLDKLEMERQARENYKTSHSENYQKT
jgi:hypothetical protein